jgi:hypothetical protein
MVSVGPDRQVGGDAVVKLRAERGAMLAVRLRPGQVRTLANGSAASWRRWSKKARE